VEAILAKQEASDEVIYLRAAGLDLGKRFLVACVRVPHPSQAGRLLETEKFGTIPREIRRLLAWLSDRRVEVVVLEATSEYWRSVYYLLQPELNLMLVNPALLTHPWVNKSGAKRHRTSVSLAAHQRRGRPPACPQAWPTGPQRLRGQGRPAGPSRSDAKRP
jgi:hypothetical protein